MYVPTEQQVADIMTNPFSMDFAQKRAQLRVLQVPEWGVQQNLRVGGAAKVQAAVGMDKGVA